KHYSASKAIVVTNNYFTKGAIDLARSNNVILIDKDKLNKLMNRSSAY
ncbi:MAG TPA: restriction endonuclease, partial [Bacteroidia bacterium]|nr:restriction endonuclease [Bacteroidia bacterium]